MYLSYSTTSSISSTSLDIEEPAMMDIVFKIPRLGTDKVAWSSMVSDIISFRLTGLRSELSCVPAAELLLRHWKLYFLTNTKEKKKFSVFFFNEVNNSNF